MGALRRENWEEFLENSTIGVHLVSADGIILWANKTELEFLGYKPEEYFGKSITEFHQDQEVIEQILSILTGGGSLRTYPAKLKASDGSTKFVLINSNVYEKDGEFVHTRCFTTGISILVYEQLRKELFKNVV